MPPIQRLEPTKPHPQPRWIPRVIAPEKAPRHPARPASEGPHRSIRDILGEAQWHGLDPGIRIRFGDERLDTHVLYTGRMKLWRSWLGALFALLSRPFGAPLPLAACDDAPAMVLVSPGACGSTIWERWVCPDASKPPITVRSTKVTGPSTSLVERLDGGLAMQLSLHEENGALIFESSIYALTLLGWTVSLPLWLTPGHCRVEHRAEGPRLFSFTLSMRHPLFGLTIFQTGLFSDPD